MRYLTLLILKKKETTEKKPTLAFIISLVRFFLFSPLPLWLNVYNSSVIRHVVILCAFEPICDQFFFKVISSVRINIMCIYWKWENPSASPMRSSGAHLRSQSTAVFFSLSLFRFISWAEISHSGKCLLSMLDSHALWNERIYTRPGLPHYWQGHRVFKRCIIYFNWIKYFKSSWVCAAALRRSCAQAALPKWQRGEKAAKQSKMLDFKSAGVTRVVYFIALISRRIAK